MEQAVTYPQAAVLFNALKGGISQIIVPGPGETVRFVVPPGEALEILPVYSPFTLAQFEGFAKGIPDGGNIPNYFKYLPVDRPQRLE